MLSQAIMNERVADLRRNEAARRTADRLAAQRRWHRIATWADAHAHRISGCR